MTANNAERREQGGGRTSSNFVVEGRANRANPSRTDIERAILDMARPNGPTYIILQDESGNYSQAAGTDRRYVIECRDVYGEGFRHWRAATQGRQSGQRTQVYYRQSCPKRKHAPRRCPIDVDATQVLGLDDVGSAILAFHATGVRYERLAWHDVTSGFLEKHSEAEDDITDIRPRSHHT